MLKNNRYAASVEVSISGGVKPWILCIRPERIDVLCASLSDRALPVILVLEAHARTKAYCWVSLETVARRTGRHLRKVQDILAELEGGWIRRVYGSRKELLGIVMLRRVDPKMPSADTPEKVAAAEATVRDEAAARKRDRGSRNMPESAHPSMPIPACPSMPESAPEEASSENKHSLEVQITPSLGNNVIALPDSGTLAVEDSTPETAGEDTALYRARLATLLGKLASPPAGKRGHAGTVNSLAKLMVEALIDDEGNTACHAKWAWRVASGELPGNLVVCAFEDAMRAAADNPAAYFVRTLQGLEAARSHEEIEAGQGRGAGRALADLDRFGDDPFVPPAGIATR